MHRDPERIDRLQLALQEAGLDALVCTLPENVLLLTGYFPIVGVSVALVTREGRTFVIVPQDEQELAECSADEVVTFAPASLDRITTAAQAIRAPLQGLIESHRLARAVIGYECGEAHEPASYASMHLYGNSLHEAFDGASLRPAAEVLARLKSVLTAIEIDRVRRACRIAQIAFETGLQSLCAGAKEDQAASFFRSPLTVAGIGFEGVARADGYAFCMSGPNSARAYGAYARSHGREICCGDLVLTHCNSYADGYWTDITRTYTMGPVNDRERQMYEAVFEARQAALDAIRPGIKAADVDRVARDVFRARGLADAFKHPTGHGVGFAAIDHNARPRLHPKSDDRLEPGMVFNVEPALYFDGFGGLRHCDMVAVTETGAELLTPFHTRMEELLR